MATLCSEGMHIARTNIDTLAMQYLMTMRQIKWHCCRLTQLAPQSICPPFWCFWPGTVTPHLLYYEPQRSRELGSRLTESPAFCEACISSEESKSKVLHAFKHAVSQVWLCFPHATKPHSLHNLGIAVTKATEWLPQRHWRCSNTVLGHSLQHLLLKLCEKLGLSLGPGPILLFVEDSTLLWLLLHNRLRLLLAFEQCSSSFW